MVYRNRKVPTDVADGVLAALVCLGLLAALGLKLEEIVGIGFVAAIVLRLFLSENRFAIVARLLLSLLIGGAIAYYFF